MATKKQRLQAEAAELGIDFTDKTTIPQLEAAIAARERPSESPQIAEDDPDGPGATYVDPDRLCSVCRKPADHVHAGRSRQKGV